MSTVLTIPLEKNKEIAALVAEMQPGERLYSCMTIKAKDDQSLIVRVEEMADKPDDLPKPDQYDKDGEKEEDDSIEEEDDNGSSPSETDEAIKLASPGGYEGP